VSGTTVSARQISMLLILFGIAQQKQRLIIIIIIERQDCHLTLKIETNWDFYFLTIWLKTIVLFSIN